VLLFGLGLTVAALPGLFVVVWVTGLYFYLKRKYLHLIVRIFQEKPLFIVPWGQPVEGAEDIHFRTRDGRLLRGCYVHGQGPRRGVILFGLEFGSNRWACLAYCEHLLENGYDIFAFESRGQGDSEPEPGYEPLQWVTEYEVEDTRSALAYLHSRPDANPRGVGFFGISKGAGAGLLAAARDPYVRCCVTDGVFATYTTLVPYMRMWFRIYNNQYTLHGMLPSWYYGRVGLCGLRQIERERHCRFPHLERELKHLGDRPLLMIHGGADAYIKPYMAERLFARVEGPKEFWLVEGAKHNGSLGTATEEYQRRVVEFFDSHLAAVEAEREDRLQASPVAAPHIRQRSGSTEHAGAES
jgi:fermentation-respiration switch protein FrsA (DUF1100 family)